MNKVFPVIGNIWLALKLLSKVAPVYLLYTLVLSALMGFMTPVHLWNWQKLIDAITLSLKESCPYYTVLGYLGLSGFIALFSSFLQRIDQWLAKVFANKMEYTISKRIILLTSEFSMEQFDDPETYDKISMAIKETPQRCLDILTTMTQLITCLFQTIGCAIILASFGRILVPISTISVLPLFLTDYINNKYWYNVYKERLEQNRFVEFLKELLIKNENIKELKLFQNRFEIISRISNIYEGFYITDKKVRFKYAIRSAGISAIDIVANYIVNTFIVISSIAAQSTIGQITMQISSAGSFRSALNVFISELSSMHEHSLYMQSLGDLEKIPRISKGKLLSMPKNFHKIEFCNVSFTYPGANHNALNNISLCFQSDKSYAIVGLNGSGKTTLLKLLLKLYKPSSGVIYLDSTDIQEIDTNEYYKSISAVFQDFIHYPFSVKDNISGVSASISQVDLINAASLSSAEEFIFDLPSGFATMLMKEWTGGVELSLGQWQKIAISRCFYRNASIYILDEPFSALDPLAEITAIENISKQKQGRLCLFITHRMTSIVLADEIVVLENGELRGKGTHAQLEKECNLYRKLYNAQAEAIDKLKTNATIQSSLD